jgi:proteasome lid subunit RPN8/RPN11
MRKRARSSDDARSIPRALFRTDRRALVVLALSAQLGVADAEGCPPISFGATHESLDKAAVQTLAELFDDGGRYESGGFFIELNGAYQASRPVTQGARRAVNYCIVLPRGARLAGIYHTHVTSTILSARDRSNAERAGVPSYIGTIRDRSLWVYDARLREVRAVEHAQGSTVAESSGDDDQTLSLRERVAALARRAANALGLF